MPSVEKLPDSLPSEGGYTLLLDVPMTTIEQLRSLYVSALHGELTSDSWRDRHAQALAGSEPALEPAELRLVEDRVNALATAVTEDFDHFMFLSELATNLRLLQAPDPERELRELEAPLSTPTGEATRDEIERRRAALRVMTGQVQAPVYEPAARMFKALQVGTLEETYRWLQAAVAEHPAASVQDLLTRAALEVAEAKLELDRYDDLKGRPDDRRPR